MSIHYELIRRKRKTVTLTVTDGKLLVYAPLNLSKKYIEEFVLSKEIWIERKIKQQTEVNQRFSAILNYEFILLFGKLYKIVFGNIKKITLFDSEIVVPKRYSNELANEKNVPLKRALAKWLKAYAEHYLFEKLNALSNSLGIIFSSFNLTNAKTKWGSCDSKNIILLNWRLIMLDESLIDYVIIHELCHAIEHNHSKEFWRRVASFAPDYKTKRKKLTQSSVLNKLFR